jgi:ABC-type lipoprotein release transport system permease subunit
MPILDNEVIVSETVYSKINKSLYYGISFTLPNLEEEKYCNAHSDVLNLYNFYESGMTIVGVYEDSEYLPDVLTTDAKFQKIKEEYFKYYVYDNYLNEGYGDIISKLNENSLVWEDPGAKAVLVFSNLKYKLNFGLYVALFLLAVVTTALLFVVFKQNFIDNKDMVKALIKEGASKKDIYWIFLFKAIAIGSIAMIVSLVTLIITLVQINQNMQVNFDIEFNIIRFRYLLYFANLFNTMLLLVGSAHLLANKLMKSLDDGK